MVPFLVLRGPLLNYREHADSPCVIADPSQCEGQERMGLFIFFFQFQLKKKSECFSKTEATGKLKIKGIEQMLVIY